MVFHTHLFHSLCRYICPNIGTDMECVLPNPHTSLRFDMVPTTRTGYALEGITVTTKTMFILCYNPPKC